MAYPEVEGLHGAEDQGQAIVDSTQRPLQGAFLIPPVLPVVLICQEGTERCGGLFRTRLRVKRLKTGVYECRSTKRRTTVG